MSRPRNIETMLARHGIGAGSIGTVTIAGKTWSMLAERTPEDFEDCGRHTTATVMRDRGIAKTVYLERDRSLYAAVESIEGDVGRVVRLRG